MLEGPKVGSKITWRSSDIYYKDNEFFMDVFEYVYFTCDFSGNVISSEI